MELLSRVTEVFREVFDVEDLAISRQTSAADISGWDSLMHVRLILKLEKAFGVRFSSAEVASFENVGDLIDAVERKISDKSVRT